MNAQTSEVYMIARSLIVLAFMAATGPAYSAGYCATGEMKAQECWGFVIESCQFVRVDAVANEDGKLFKIQRCFESVSDYSARDSRCWIRTKSRGAGVFSWAANAIVQPKFMHKKDDGSYKKVDAEYLTFNCKKK